MGQARFAPQDIPLRLPEADPYRLSANGSEVEFGAVSMGNPHAVIEVADVATAPLETLGAALSLDGIFHKAAMSALYRIVDRARVRLRVWERGAGATLAAAPARARPSPFCAAAARSMRRRRRTAGRHAADPLDRRGCSRDDVGPTEFVFEGEYEHDRNEPQGRPERNGSRQLSAPPPGVLKDFRTSR
jgi:diaminopimelate epimerase